MTKPIMLLLSLLAASPSMGQANKDILNIDLQAAIQKESVQGDLKAAIAMYEKIVARAGSERAIAAQALLRIGQCQEKLGSAEARKAYERLLRDFSDQIGATEARARIAQLNGVAVTAHTIYSSPDVYGPRINRDGQKAAALCPDGICLFDVASGTSRTGVVKPQGIPGNSYWRPLPSPDGQSIAFTYYDRTRTDDMGDLRLQRVGQPTASTLITARPAERDYFSAVDWTADGKQILVATTNKEGSGLLVISAAGGTPRPIDCPGFDWTTGRDHSRFSPDGKWIAYPTSKRELQGGGFVPTDVVIIPATGGQPQTAFAGTGDERVVGWLANGDLVATSNRNGKRLPYRLHIVDGKPQGEPQILEEDLGDAEVVGVSITTGALFVSSQATQRELFSFKPGQDAMSKFTLGYQAATPTFSPDGTRLAYVTGGDSGPSSVVIRDLASGAERRLPGNVPRIRNLGWYPNGRHIFAVCNEGNWASIPVFRFDTLSGEIKPLPNITGMSSYWWAAILADGKTLVYSGREQGQMEAILRALDTESGELRTIFRAMAPYWSIGATAISPDRKQIAFSQSSRQFTESAIAIIDVEDPKPRIVYECESKDCKPLAPFFTPDQRSLLFWRGSGQFGGTEELWQLPIAKGEATLLRKHPFTYDGPAFHPKTGEIIIGVSKVTSELRVQPLRNR